MRKTQSAHIGDLEPKSRQGISHDRTIPTEFGFLRYQLDVRAPARRAGDALGKPGNAGHMLKRFGALTLVHYVDDFIDESIQPYKSRELGDARQGLEQSLSAAFAELRRVHQSVSR